MYFKCITRASWCDGLAAVIGYFVKEKGIITNPVFQVYSSVSSYHPNPSAGISLNTRQCGVMRSCVFD